MEKIIKTLKELNIKEDEIEKIITYIKELIKWNTKINLIGKNEPEWILKDLIIPVILIREWIEEGEVIEIGAGSGIVSVVLSILNKNARFTLIERREKKCVFLRYIRKELEIDFDVFCKDVKEGDFKKVYDYLILRGVKLEDWHLNIARKVIYFGKTKNKEIISEKKYKNILITMIKGNV